VAGDKGTGKTALYRILQKRYPGLLDDVEVLAGFNPVGAPVFQRLVEGDPLSEGQYITIWKAYFLALVGNWVLALNEGALSHQMVELRALGVSQDASNMDLFNAVFPEQVDQGSRRPTTWNWMLARTRDGNGIVPPRNLIDLVKKAQEAQLRAEQRREGTEFHPEGSGGVIQSDAIKRAGGAQ